MFIETQATSDPATLKFLPGRQVLASGSFDASTREAAAQSPLAHRLFGVEGVTRVVLGSDWIGVTQTRGDWAHLKPAVLGAIMEHYLTGAGALEAPGDAETPKDRFSAVGDPNESATMTQVREAIRQVIDPELGFNILDLGLIYDVSFDGEGGAKVLMTTTTPGCPATNYLMSGAREAALSADGIETAEVELTHDPRWGPEMMTSIAKAHFGIPEGEGW
ncbi:MAG: NifU N-terminal domain-containing protein [Rubellimicrobium sp.]|nr:NifU N-terminal domain-containing protein [Rubellimicrobium sp.]